MTRKRAAAGDPQHQIRIDDNVTQIPNKKNKGPKPMRVPACLIRIGSWQKSTYRDAEISVQCCFGQKKLRWDVRMDNTICRMEVTWSNISAMRTYSKDDKTDVLEIELHEKPYFLADSLFGMLKLSFWSPVSDFTGGQASIYRRHYLEFHSGQFNRIYKKLLENNLLEQSRQQFPYHNSEYFPKSEQPIHRNLPSSSVVPCTGHPTHPANVPASTTDDQHREYTGEPSLSGFHPSSSLISVPVEPHYTTPSIFSHQPSPLSGSELSFRVGLIETPCLDMYIYPQLFPEAYRTSISRDATNMPEMQLPVRASFGDAPQYPTCQTTYNSPPSPSISELLEMVEQVRANSPSHQNPVCGYEDVETDLVDYQVEDSPFTTSATDPYDGLLESIIRPYFDVGVPGEAPPTSQAPMRDLSGDAALNDLSSGANAGPGDRPGPNNY